MTMEVSSDTLCYDDILVDGGTKGRRASRFSTVERDVTRYVSITLAGLISYNNILCSLQLFGPQSHVGQHAQGCSSNR